MKLSDLAADDVVTYWHEKYANECEICYAKVVRVNRVTVTLKGERGEVARWHPSYLNRKLAPHEWRPDSLKS